MTAGEMKHTADVLAAAERVGRIFDQGCDRCDSSDLELLESAGLMEQGVCADTFGQDTLEVGETMWSFNAKGSALVKKLLGETP